MFGMGSESFRKKLCKIMHEQIIACTFDMADVKKKTLDVEHITASIKCNTAILNYNVIAGNSNAIPLPPLPYID